MKRLPYITPLLLFVFFFFFSSEVKADTIEYLIPDANFSIFSSSDYSTIQSLISTEMSSNNYTYYIMYFPQDSWTNDLIYTQVRVKFYNSIPSYSIIYYTGTMRIYSSASCLATLDYNLNTHSYAYGNTNGWANMNFYQNGSEGFPLIESNFPLISTISDTIDFSSSYGIISMATSSNWPTLYDFTQLSSGDDYPILTSFFTLFLDRLGYLANYITESYVMLSVIVTILLITLFTFIKERRFLP